jgi:ATP-binding cassette, subfamily B, bacterial PglK
MKVFHKLQALLTKSEQKSAIALLIMMVMGMFLEAFSIGLVVPLLTLMIQDNISQKYSFLDQIYSSTNHLTEYQVVILGMLLLVTIYAFKNLFIAWLTWWQARFSFDIQKHVSQKLFETYLGQPYAFHLTRNSAQLIRNATIEANLLTVSVSAFLLLVTEVLVILGVVTLLIAIEPLGALVIVGIFSIAGYAFLKLTRNRISQWGIDRQFHEGMRIQQLQQGLGAVKDIILLNIQRYFLNQYSLHNSESARVAANQMTLQNMPRLFLESLAIVGLAVLVLLMMAQGTNFTAIVPTLGLFAAAAFRLLPSANRVLQSIQTVRYGIPIIELLHDEIELSERINTTDQITISKFSSSIQVRNLSFTYPQTHKPALENIDLTIYKGDFIGLIGTSGSGKSTLIDMLMGLHTPQLGEISVDGKDIRLSIQSWQSQIGYVPQTIYLTDDSLRRNIAFGIPDDKINIISLERAIAAAQLDEFIQQLEFGLDTEVGERGLRLSGGQRQRIGIARALYHDPDILVLDEATSALDTFTEASVMSAIDALHGIKTVIIVAHRLSTVANCDRLYKFEQGRLMNETGPENH